MLEGEEEEEEEGERGGANLNALEFRKFLINRSARDRIRVAICILNISWRASPSDAERERPFPTPRIRVCQRVSIDAHASCISTSNDTRRPPLYLAVEFPIPIKGTGIPLLARNFYRWKCIVRIFIFYLFIFFLSLLWKIRYEERKQCSQFIQVSQLVSRIVN